MEMFWFPFVYKTPGMLPQNEPSNMSHQNTLPSWKNSRCVCVCAGLWAQWDQDLPLLFWECVDCMSHPLMYLSVSAPVGRTARSGSGQSRGRGHISDCQTRSRLLVCKSFVLFLLSFFFVCVCVSAFSLSHPHASAKTQTQPSHGPPRPTIEPVKGNIDPWSLYPLALCLGSRSGLCHRVV